MATKQRMVIKISLILWMLVVKMMDMVMVTTATTTTATNIIIITNITTNTTTIFFLSGCYGPHHHHLPADNITTHTSVSSEPIWQECSTRFCIRHKAELGGFFCLFNQ